MGRDLVPGVVMALAVCVFYGPLVTGRTLTTGGDMANLYVPTCQWVGERVGRDGVWPLWNPFTFCGHPLAAAAQSAVYYPPARLFFRGQSDIVGAMNRCLLAHLLWAALGVWAFARARSGLGLRGWGPALAGFVFAAGGWLRGNHEHVAATATVAWMPWVVWAAGATMSARRPLAPALGFAAALALQILAGHPQEAFITLMAALPWAALKALGIGDWRLGIRRMAEGERQIRNLRSEISNLRFQMGDWMRRAAWLAGAVALAGGLAAIQLLPTFELSPHSYRRFDDAQWAANFSMPPRLLATLVWPHAFGSYATGHKIPLTYDEYLGLHIGVPALALALISLWAARRKPTGPLDSEKRRPRWRFSARFWVLIAFAGVLLALGGNADPRRILNFHGMNEFPEPGWSPLRLLVTLTPPARHFRVPGRYLLLFAFSASLLAACGIRAIEAGLRKRAGGRKNLGQDAQATGNLGQDAQATGADSRGRQGRMIMSGIAVGVAGLLVFVSLYWPARRERLAFRARYEQAFAQNRWPTDVPAGAELDNRIYRLTTFDDELLARDSAAPGVGDDLTADERVAVRAARLMPNTNLFGPRALVDGYEEGLLPLVRLKDFLLAFNRSLRRADPDARLLAVGGVRWLWSDLPVESPDWRRVEPWSAPGALFENRLWRGTAFDPAAFPDVDWTALDGPWQRKGVPALDRGHEEIPYAKPDFAKSAGAQEAAVARWTTRLESPNEIVCRRVPNDASASAADSPQRLIIAQTAYPQWKARDSRGRPLKSRGLNVWNTEIRVPAGVNEVRFVYEPWSFRLGAFMTATALFVFAALAAFQILRRPPRPR